MEPPSPGVLKMVHQCTRVFAPVRRLYTEIKIFYALVSVARSRAITSDISEPDGGSSNAIKIKIAGGILDET